METKRSVIRDELDVKEYNPFIVNRALSNHQDCIFRADEMNRYADLPKDVQYQYHMAAVVPRRRPFVPWNKKAKNDDLALVMREYGYSATRAFEALAILSDEQLQAIRDKYQGI